jgi:hypothetical protein
MTYKFNGEVHHITPEEVEAIDRSGRSSWRYYADTPSIPHRMGVLNLCAAMNHGLKTWEKPSRATPKPIHLQEGCKTAVLHGGVPADQFTVAVLLERSTCHLCFEKYVASKAKASKLYI